MSRSGEEGFILIAALVMLAALAALASAYAVYAMETAPSAALPEERLQAEAALRAGVELCAFRQLAGPRATRPRAGAFSAWVGATKIGVSFRSENARVDLNTAPRDLVANLFIQLDVSKATAGFLADRIFAWSRKLDDDEQKQEAAIYEKAGLSYRPPGGPFDNPLEISLLPGISPALAKRALRYVTIFSPSGKIDPFVADPLVIAAIPGITPQISDGFLAARSGPPLDADALAQLAGATANFVSANPGSYIRADIVATLRGREIHAEVVLKVLEHAPAPYEILFWRDDFDGYNY